MSRHGKMADDSASICVVVPKQIKNRIHSLIPNGFAFSDIVRQCLELGASALERMNERRSRIAMRRAQRLEMSGR